MLCTDSENAGAEEREDDEERTTPGFDECHSTAAAEGVLFGVGAKGKRLYNIIYIYIYVYVCDLVAEG